jgi:hypothetical protein
VIKLCVDEVRRLESESSGRLLIGVRQPLDGRLSCLSPSPKGELSLPQFMSDPRVKRIYLPS